jgi:signal transduction histidine kinase
VCLKLVQDKEQLVLNIKDDGIGVDLSKKTTGIGLMNVKTRASLFDGEVVIRSEPGNGFELWVRMRVL